MINQWTHKFQIHFWEVIVDLLPRIKPLVKLVWAIHRLLQAKRAFMFLVKAGAIAVFGFLTGVFLYLFTAFLQ